MPIRNVTKHETKTVKQLPHFNRKSAVTAHHFIFMSRDMSHQTPRSKLHQVWSIYKFLRAKLSPSDLNLHAGAARAVGGADRSQKCLREMRGGARPEQGLRSRQAFRARSHCQQNLRATKQQI